MFFFSLSFPIWRRDRTLYLSQGRIHTPEILTLSSSLWSASQTVFVCATDFCTEYLNRMGVWHVQMRCVCDRECVRRCVCETANRCFIKTQCNVSFLLCLVADWDFCSWCLSFVHLFPNERLNSQSVWWKKQNVLSAFCPKPPQTILEDEVDDPVYQVGPQTHRYGTWTLLILMLF